MFDAKEAADRPAKRRIDRGAADPGLRRATQVVPRVEGWMEAGERRHETPPGGARRIYITVVGQGCEGPPYSKKLDSSRSCTKEPFV